jgi:very-short-patch-repair endonuclease
MNIAKKKSILVTHPLIASDWDAERNINSTIENISSTEKTSVWWTCANGHSYAVSPYTRLRTNGCKFCNKEKNESKNLLLTRLLSGNSKRFTDVASKEIVSQWSLELNDIKPHEVTSHSKLKIEWQCKYGHIWKATPSSRIKGGGCPECYKLNRIDILLKAKLQIAGKSLLDEYPKLIEEWDFSKNKRKPNELTPNSNYKVFWRCRFNHSWEATIYNRTGNGSGCPECSGSGTSKIEIYILCELRKLFEDVRWRKKIDSFELDIFIPKYAVGIEIDGEYWHRNKAEKDRKKSQHLKSKEIDLIRVRSDKLTETDDHTIIIKGKSNTDDFQKITNEVVYYLSQKIGKQVLVDYCSDGKQLASEDYQEMISRLPAPPKGESFLAVYPDIAIEWNHEKNSPLTPDLFTPKSDQKFWWICFKNHTWQATIKNRTIRNSGCPHCFNENRAGEINKRHLSKLGSISEKYPEVLPFWDHEKNNPRDPENITAVLTNTYSWICKEGHDFTRLLKSMVKDTSCNRCQSIHKTHPELLKEWDYEKNSEINPLEIRQGSGISLWWICENGHSWSASIVRRLKDNKKCYICLSLGFRFPYLLNEWDFEKNTELDPMVVHAGTKKKAWWKCLHDHQWETSIDNRTGDKKSNCPVCARKIAAEKTRLVKLNKSGSLKDNFPEIALKWNKELNKDLTPNKISSNSHTPVWWTCNCGNFYEQTPNNMVTLLNRGSDYRCNKCS